MRPELSETLFLLAGAVVVGLGIVISVVMNRRRRSIWTRFARRRGWRLGDGPEGLEVRGSSGGRRYELCVSPESSDTGELGMQVVRMSAELHGELPAGFELHELQGLLGQAGGALEEGRIETDAAFDAIAAVKAESAAEANRYLDKERKSALADLIVKSGPAFAGIERGAVYLEERDMVSRLETIEEYYSLLQQAAPILDAGK